MSEVLPLGGPNHARRGGGQPPSIDTDDEVRVAEDAYGDQLPPTGEGREAPCPGCRYEFAEAIARDHGRLVYSCPRCRRRFYVEVEYEGRPRALNGRP